MVKGKKYRIPVVGSVLDYSHGFYRTIEEIFIPELGIAFNQEGFAFPTSEERYKSSKLFPRKEVELIGEVEIQEKEVKILKNYLQSKKELQGLAKRHFYK